MLFINDLPDVLNPGTQVYLFADDTKLYRQINSIRDCRLLQDDLDSLAQWSEDWLLQFHPKKCKVMEIGPAGNREYEYKLLGTKLEHVKSEKDIGVEIDGELKFTTHISNKINKANSIMGVIRRTFKYLDPETFSKLYKSLVRPHLEYANAVWNPYLKKDILAIENVQRRATKLIPGFRDLSYEQRLQRLKLPTLVYRRLRGDMIEVFKILTGIYDPRASKGLLPLYRDMVRNPERMRGHKWKLYKTRSRLNLRHKFFGNRVVDIWNDLPEHVVDAPSVHSFERRLDRVWRDQDILYNFKSALEKCRANPAEYTLSSDEDLDT